ncbi:hypothetical protein Tco_0782212 [Tanacetum coccineum]
MKGCFSRGVSKAKSTDKGKRYRRRARSMAKNINTGLDAEDEINTGRVEINTGIEDVNTGSTKVDTGRTSISTSSIILSPKKGQREGKAQMVKEDIQATHKTKEQIRQEEAGLEEAIRLQAQMDEEAEVQEAAQFYTEEDWDTIREKLEANTEVVKSLKGESISNDDFAKGMVEMINEKKKLYAEQKAKVKRSKPMTQAQQREYMSTFIKNQSSWKLSQLKKFSFEELKTEFEKLMKSIESFGKDKVVKEEEAKVSVKKIRKRRKQKERKGINIDKTTQDEFNNEREAFLKDKVKDASSESEIGVDAILTATKPHTIANWKIISQSNFSRDDLIELYRLVIKKYGANRPEEMYDRVLWGDLKTIYLKGQPKLGLWYPRDSPFDLEAFSNSDYAGASLDRKSTTRGCQFLGKRLISWQCKKQTIVANSTTEAEYVAAANCCGQVLWIQNLMLDYGFNFMNTKIYIDNESTICIVKNLVFHSKTKHIEIRHHFIREFLMEIEV